MMVGPRLKHWNRYAKGVLGGLLLGMLTGNLALGQGAPPPPAPVREFRGAWVATVRGIDWPNEPGASMEKQKAEITKIINKAAALRLNAIIFQVRPAADAVYKSELEPWSPWFTGGMDKAPKPEWDPLEFFIQEAHAKGIELHAWFNPFRALSGPRFKGAGKHISQKHPEWCWKYGENLWMDPGEPGVRQLSKDVILDVVRRYDVDGVHMDDYFYPYPVKDKKGAKVEFPDNKAWAAYQKKGGALGRSDWRRENVDTFVRELYAEVKAAKPWVRVGISPFGIWRPNFPEGYAKGAMDPFEDLAADSLKWLQNGWCDYLAPQLYWPTDPPNLSFNALFDWWLMQNTSRRHIWPGIASERVLKDRQPSEILRQISYTRARSPYMPPGHLHWSFSALSKNLGALADLCEKRAYPELAVPPSASWLGSDKPPVPTAKRQDKKLEWSYSDARLEGFIRWWVVQSFEKGQWHTYKVLPAEIKSLELNADVTAVAVRAISKTGMGGEPVVIR